MVMARSRLKRWISVGAFSNSSDASCDSGSVVPAIVGTRTWSSAANSACCVMGVRTMMGYCSPDSSLNVPTGMPATDSRTARSSSAVWTPSCCALRESMRSLRLVRATLSGFFTSRVPGVAFTRSSTLWLSCSITLRSLPITRMEMGAEIGGPFWNSFT